ncbi:DUF3313 domain-containing protein [Paraburkholderia guartelaensis]|uniref:DUF3313 domain-containing protein n=2 Tax=Paraburkholderia guartelaensis TaxID=2546446 RepID=A0A4V2ZUW4_9BURK|nr:DUF3313 domain-containing protein [Paraburkholderia guartelaensis]
MLATVCLALFATLVLALSACSAVRPVKYSSLASSPYLRVNPDDRDGTHMPYRYALPQDWSRYRKLILEPVQIYGGPDAEFHHVNAAECSKLAQFMQATFAERLATRFDLVNEPGADTLRVRLTLTGAGTALPGYVIYAVEILDSSSNQLVEAFIERYPDGRPSARLSSPDAPRTGIERGADELLAQFR